VLPPAATARRRRGPSGFRRPLLPALDTHVHGCGVCALDASAEIEVFSSIGVCVLAYSLVRHGRAWAHAARHLAPVFRRTRPLPPPATYVVPRLLSR
jgi:hypothetical protein